MIDILLATYNGEAFLKKQIDSLLAQEFEDWRLLVRDDGSSDRTAVILQTHQKSMGERLTILPACRVNLGPRDSFSSLLQHADADYIMLCDQDDVWLPGKIAATLKKMHALEAQYGKDRPLLVHSDFKVVDENLHLLADSGWRYQKTDPRHGAFLNRLLVQNVATGCTVMLNRPLRDLALPVPPGAIMHDWWLTLVAGAFGKTGFVAEPLLLYRQHRLNAVGAKSWGMGRFLKQLCSPEEFRHAFLRTQQQAGAFLDRYHDRLSPEDRQMVRAFSQLDSLSFFAKRFSLLRYGFFHPGLARKVGMFLFC